VVRIRLRRIGSKGQPSYRMIVADAEAPRDGRFLKLSAFTIRARCRRQSRWTKPRAALVGVGAQPSESVTRLLTKCGTMGRFARLKSGEALDVLLAKRPRRPRPPLRQPKTAYAETAGKKPSERRSRRQRPRLSSQRPSRPPSPPCSFLLIECSEPSPFQPHPPGREKTT